jgi:antitoxin component YwqK of YwqJK toxin-antitoxin module
MRASVFFFLLSFHGIVIAQNISAGQPGSTIYKYHDIEKQHLKEIYQVKDTVSKTPHGTYISYFLNGNVESKGQFINGETAGIWEFYFETGGIKMRGIVRQNSNYGLWEYFYENGVKSMEGVIQGKSKEGDWKIYYESSELKETGRFMDNKRNGFWRTYFEDGTIKGEIEYVEDVGRYTEYFHSGKKLGEGPKTGSRNTGLWRYYTEAGTLESEGLYEYGKKVGEWKYYFPSGKVSCIGYFTNDEPSGRWNYYFEDGKLSSSGVYMDGKRNGYWSSINPNGTVKSEINYFNGSGDYREYYATGKLKVKGSIVEGKNHGQWLYYYEDGKKEGECVFVMGKGLYYGYYPNGTMQTKGPIENDRRVGTWELYEQDGVLSGYYKPLYQDKDLDKQINALMAKSKSVPPPIPRRERKGFHYFKPRDPEYKSIIIQGDPLFMFLGSFPAGLEFYNQERLGHEIGIEGIRNPFFTADSEVQDELRFQRGYAVFLRQKFYNEANFGMWYFGQSLKYTDLNHYVNMPNQISPASATEVRFEYGWMLGTRLMNRNDGNGFTIDAFVGYGVGYRKVNVKSNFEDEFSSLSRNNFASAFQFGLNFGYSVSVDRK